MNRSERMIRALDALALGEAFGVAVAKASTADLERREPPPGPWSWHAGTHVCLSVAEVLLKHGEIDQELLSYKYSRRYEEEPHRGYGAETARLFEALIAGADWRSEAKALRGGEGSLGAGGAVVGALIGAFFASHPALAVDEARKAAVITHAHSEGIAGALAAAALAALRFGADRPRGEEFIAQVMRFTPRGATRDRIAVGADIAPDQLETARAELGGGQLRTALDSVPLCVWMVAHHGSDLEAAWWNVAAGGGDVRAPCAILGAAFGGSGATVPAHLRALREPLPTSLSLNALH